MKIRCPSPKPSAKLSLHARKRSAKGAEVAVDIDARGWPAIATVAFLVAVVAMLVVHVHGAPG
jgi:hypothetical protein